MKRVKGQGLVEYALILILIAIIVIGMVTLLGDRGEHRCSHGYIYSEQENACLRGYRP